jgi:uncharacterized protein (TIGR02118 family)
MLKLVACFRRKAGLSPEQFQEHWHTTHAELVVRQKGMRRYVQNHTLLSAYERGEPDYDGVAEAWFDGTQAMRDLAPSAEYAAVRADEANFIDAASMGVVLTDEVVIVDGTPPAGALKWIGFIRKRSDVSVDFFQKYWSGTHAAIAARIPGNRRYVQCHARKGIYASGRSPDYDGVPMSWFDDLAALRASSTAPEYEATRADEANFMAPGRIPFVVAAEREIAV